MDPIIQVLRPVSPLAWFPLGLILFSSVKLLDGSGKTVFGASDAAALFTIAVCAMWPTVMNTAVGVRAVPTDYLNVARVLNLSEWMVFTRILFPAVLPYMLTGRPGVGGFLWQEYNANHYAQIILSILAIGIIGLLLDRLMSLVESRFKTA